MGQSWLGYTMKRMRDLLISKEAVWQATARQLWQKNAISICLEGRDAWVRRRSNSTPPVLHLLMAADWRALLGL
ncbi:hypothetical protein RchiOBHm_Chr4g0432771 [Rosa chinensis]|uniref:Uncharacterized protein n=1 Tax=Rosa chinensis TaxID=74649 RepID=A0A2P6R117_ROSCH|nr:hypothetical protein RchiOBHm_Chr4g0432771 [Rosa chinensis]